MYSNEPKRDYKIDQLKWLIGNWVQRSQNTIIQENWLNEVSNTMIGTFRWSNGRKILFYEFMSISITDFNCVMKIKHFGEDLVGWEEKDKYVEFILTDCDSRMVIFKMVNTKDVWLKYDNSFDNRLLISFYPTENSPIGDKTFELFRE